MKPPNFLSAPYKTIGAVAAGLAVVNCNGDEGASATAQGTHQIAVVTEGDPRTAPPANAWNCV